MHGMREHVLGDDQVELALEGDGEVVEVDRAARRKAVDLLDEELLVLIGKDEFLKSNTVAIKALLDDLATATRFYLEKPREARQIILDSKMVRVPADVFLGMSDYYRDPTMRVDVETLARMQEYQVKAGFQKKATDVRLLVDMSYLPN